MILYVWANTSVKIPYIHCSSNRFTIFRVQSNESRKAQAREHLFFDMVILVPTWGSTDKVVSSPVLCKGV